MRISGHVAGALLLAALCGGAFVAAGCGGGGRDEGRRPAGPRRWEIKVGPATALVEVAATPEARQRGLMGRRDLGADEGMLFLFVRAERLSFWMKDTPTPLSIAFVTPDGKIAEIVDMEAWSLQTHVSRLPALMALEMHAGWFARNGVKPGDAIVLPADFHLDSVR